jgi:hypothetical protein
VLLAAAPPPGCGPAGGGGGGGGGCEYRLDRRRLREALEGFGVI